MGGSAIYTSTRRESHRVDGVYRVDRGDMVGMVNTEDVMGVWSRYKEDELGYAGCALERAMWEK